MAPSGETHLDIGLAVLTSAGGLMGYMKKGSLPSLIGGCGFGAAYAFTAYVIQNKDAVLGHQYGAGVSFAMAAVMGARLVRTKKVMPAGLLTVGGLAGVIYHIRQLRAWTA